jgi:hypothetical protein
MTQLINREALNTVVRHEHFKSYILRFISFTQEWRNMPFSPFGFTVEVAGVTPFLDRQPIDVLLDGSVQDLPWITSVTTEEGLYPAAGTCL